MKRFVYSPAVQAYIKCETGILDVSADIISGSVTRRVNAASSATIVLQNYKRKYLMKVKPMDRMVVYLTRIKPMLVFSGYVDTADIDQLYPGPVTISASCTLKRLMYTYWDPGLDYTKAFFQRHGWTFDNLTGLIQDDMSRSLYNLDINNGLGEMLRVVMNEVGGWPIGRAGERNTVHVLQIPNRFLQKTEQLIKDELEATAQQREDIIKLLQGLMTVDGAFGDPFSPDSSANHPLATSFSDTNPLPKALAGKYEAVLYGKAASTITAEQIDLYLTKKDSPMAGEGKNFVASGLKYDVDPRFIVALAAQETSFGKNVSLDWGTFQAFNYQKGRNYSSWADAIDVVTNGISGLPPENNKAYFAAGKMTPQAIYLGTYCGSGCHTEALTGVLNDLGASYTSSARLSAYAGDIKPEDKGNPGEVKVRNLDDFTGAGTGGFTFKIKGNPYGNDDLIFKAVASDRSLPDNGIAIWLPSNTSQAQAWTPHEVTLQTSIGGPAFQKPDTAPTPAAVDPSKMTQDDLTHGGQSTTGLAPIALAGLAFIQANFGPFRLNAGYSPTGHASNSDHHWGGALDLAPVNASNVVDWGNEGVARCDALAAWAGWSSNNGGNTEGNPVTRWVGWRTEENHGPGNHIHISFIKGVSVSQIPTKGAIPVTSADQSYAGTTGVKATEDTVAEIAASVNLGMPLIFPLALNEAESNMIFRGARALANDVPLFEFVEFLCKASGRNFQSMPNGDFLAFHPDYFNWSNQSPYLTISDIETMDLTIAISDDKLATHVFTTADSFYANGQIDIPDKLASTVASVESISTFRDLIDVQNDFNPTEFLKRYGPRPLSIEVPEIKNSFMQFMYGWMQFLENWAMLFNAQPTFTFLPELYPGGLIEFKSKDLVMYINSVTHNFDLQGGFTTSAELIAPSTSSRKFHYGMVLSDGGFSAAIQQKPIVPTSD
jgi:hypothetical protein